MDLNVTFKQPINIMMFMRDAGFHPIVDFHTKKESWVRLLSGSHYPRFHLYVRQDDAEVEFSLHLDQKQSTMKIAGLKRHAGEYDTPVVAAELERIKRWVAYYQQR